MEVTERDRQIETLLAQVEADKVGVILDILANVHTIYRIAFRNDTKSYPLWCEHLSDIWLSTLEVDAAHLYKNRAKITVLMCEQKPYPVVSTVTLSWGLRRKLERVSNLE